MRYDFYKKSYKDLTDKEKELLYEIGSIPLLFFLGHINKVYSPSTSPEKFEKHMDKTNAAGTDLLDHNTYSLNASARESQLKEQVDILLEAHPNKRYLLPTEQDTTFLMFLALIFFTEFLKLLYIL